MHPDLSKTPTLLNPSLVPRTSAVQRHPAEDLPLAVDLPVDAEGQKGLKFFAWASGGYVICQTCCCSFLPPPVASSIFSVRKTTGSVVAAVCDPCRHASSRGYAYHVVKSENYPPALRGWTWRMLLALRPVFYTKRLSVAVPAGYRPMGQQPKVYFDYISVADKLRKLSRCSPDEGIRAKVAFEYLMSNCPRYSCWLRRQQQVGEDDRNLSISEPYLQVALFPNLYFTDAMCDVVVNAPKTRPSIVTSFLQKAMHAVVLDYRLVPDLFHYVWHVWIFKMVTAKLVVGRSLGLYPRETLASCPLSSEFWLRHQFALQDALLMYGTPSVFVTISVNDVPHGFPFPSFLTDEANLVQGSLRLVARFSESFLSGLRRLVPVCTSSRPCTTCSAPLYWAGRPSKPREPNALGLSSGPTSTSSTPTIVCKVN